MKALNTKKRIKDLAFSICTLASFSLMAQGNWEDNSGAPSNVKTSTTDPVGIGTVMPEGRLEITYCPTPTPSNGLVVTQDDCSGGAVGVGHYLGSGSFGFVDPDPNPGSGGSEVIVRATGIPWVFHNAVNHTTPIGHLLSSHSSNPVPSMPLIWARTKNFNTHSGQKEYSTKFMVMPNGFTGINTATPRTNLDVVATSGWGTPVAIFATQARSNQYTGASNGLSASFTRHLSVVPNCRDYSFNGISKEGDVGLFYTDGFGKDASAVDNGSNEGAGLVIAPWSTNSAIGGLRMDSEGNIEARGDLQCTNLNVASTWWSDFVFAKEYQLRTLESLETYILKNQHLPEIPSEKEVLENGIDVADMQALQQQKIEELTLYTIDQEKKIKAQEARLQKLEALLLNDN